ncbi:peptide chain release factor 1 [Argonema antarcticum]|uniref:peptide chain release factor 1 n=1 Tax=Argonema antarcticum TaxID=2942763 RepID=UPI0020135E8C|nr:peptide chain release factor 1 [Argonema antarcticum]MCL1472262.1 peptide chain release factor 1 [Argonema antarcticum A004/B2]
MSDPLRSLKYLPWLSLFQVSAFTTLIVAILEFLLNLGLRYSSLIRATLSSLYAPPLGVLMIFLVAASVGILAVCLLERFYPQVRINGNVLWALVPCLALVLSLKLLLPLPVVLVNLQGTQLMGLPLGIFWQGQRYWR